MASISPQRAAEPSPIGALRAMTRSSVTPWRFQAAPFVLQLRRQGWNRSIAAANFASGVFLSSNSSQSALKPAAWSLGKRPKIRSAATASRSCWPAILAVS